jgi:two-component system, chemotaxis family, protein-glutamate methylesterase/glutaminase
MTPTTVPPRWPAVDAVVLGASAGGVEALLDVAAGLPGGFPLPLLVVLHLPRDRPSGLVPLLADRCAAPVREAEDKMPLTPGVIVAPPDYHLLVEPGGWIALSRDEPVLFSRPSIDVLFESAAAALGDRVLGILLTGANHDGSAGMAALRRAGGIGWVQDPRDAAVPTLPSAALAHAGADAVLSLNEICDRLAAAVHTR